MKKYIITLFLASMICLSMTVNSIKVNKNEMIENKNLTINLPTESSEVNTKVLNDINTEVDKYLNFGQYITGDPPRKEPKNIEFPWTGIPLSTGDFVDWIIRVNYKDKSFYQEININPIDFKDRFLEHPWHYEACFFDTDQDGSTDLKVYYSIFTSQLTNLVEGIDIKSIRTCLKVDTAELSDRTAKLEVWSEIKLNYGLIKETPRSRDSTIVNKKVTMIFSNLLEKIKVILDKIDFLPIKNQYSRIFNLYNTKNNNDNKLENNNDYKITANDNDWIALGIGVSSPEGEKIPIYFEKRLNVAKDNIFSPVIFEQELHEINDRQPLGLLFGFQAFKAGTQTPSLDVAFEIDFDPCISIRTQFIPREAYIYYYYDTESGNSKETRVTFTTNGFGLDDVELSLIFDNTNPLVGTSNWMSFELEGLGFKYKANKKHYVGVLLTSPSFSTKLKLSGIPTSITCGFDVDLSFTYQQGHLLDASGTGSLNLNMNSDLDDAILYYPELSSNEPKIEFLKVTGIPASQSLSANAHIKVQNGSMTTLLGEGYVDLTMSSNLDKIQVFYRKADPADPDKLFIDVPQGIPASQRVGAMAQLYIDLNNFSNQNNYVYGKAYRTSSGNLQEIDGYLPGQTEPIVKITEIPSNSLAEAKLEWNKLKGYAYAQRYSTSNPDPIELNIDIGTFNIYNFFQIRDGFIDLDFYLNQDGYFGFNTANEMIADELKVTDTSTGNQLIINADEVSADNLWADWDLNLNEQPLQVEELAFSGSLSLLRNLELSATFQGKNLAFSTDWQVGESGEFALDFTQDEPVEILIDDLFPDNPTYDLGGGVVISDDFHFDIKWKWVQGDQTGDHGYFKINEDTNDPNFDYIGLVFKYTPSGYTTPQYGIDVSATNVGVIVYMEWWKHPSQWIPQVWWYIYVIGNFDLDLLWKGTWYYNVEDW